MPSESTDSRLESAKVVTSYLLRKPVEQAVREALHEEAVTVQRPESDRSSESDEKDGSDEKDDSESGVSKLGIGLVLVTLGGVAYFVRRRQQSEPGWSSDTETTREHGHEEHETQSVAGGGEEHESPSTVSDDS